MLTINPQNTEVTKLYSYLSSTISPRPIALASTISPNGIPNLSPFSFFNVFSADPPVLIFSPVRRMRDASTKHTLENIKEVREVVVNVVNYDMVHQTSLSSTEYKEGINEFEKAGFTMLESEVIQPFRVAESPVQFECKVNDIIELGKNGGAGNLIICEIVRIHLDENILDKNKAIDQKKLDLVARAGGNYYSRIKETFFEIPKPVRSKGIGVDALPAFIRNSTILTGNDLGMLGNVSVLPNQQSVDKFMADKAKFIGIKLNEKHKFAKEYLEKSDVESALKILLS